MHNVSALKLSRYNHGLTYLGYVIYVRKPCKYPSVAKLFIHSSIKLNLSLCPLLWVHNIISTTEYFHYKDFKTKLRLNAACYFEQIL